MKLDEGRQELVLVEPGCRGSRLHLLANTVAALKAHRDIFVITRSDYENEHFRELMAPHQGAFQVVPASTNLGGAWIKTLSWAEFQAFVRCLRDVQGKLKQPYDLFFMAIDDYPGSFARMGLWARGNIRPRRTWAGKWRVDNLLPGRSTLRQVFLRTLTLNSLRLWRADLVVFDERLADRACPNLKIHVLPDPWFGSFSPGLRAEARRRYGYRPDQFVALTIGRQDARKGFPLIASAFESLLKDHPDVILSVAGPVVEPLRPRLTRLLEMHTPQRVRHADSFIPESDLPYVLASADVVLMPYSKQYTASSGVLPRAAASGVPVLAPRHGLVGHRVLTWRLGEVFEAESTPDFIASFQKLKNSSAAMDREGMKAFAATCDFTSFAGAIHQIMGGF